MLLKVFILSLVIPAAVFIGVFNIFLVCLYIKGATVDRT